MATTDLPPLVATIPQIKDHEHHNLPSEAQNSKLSFDPAALKQKYLAERDKRMRNDGGVEQYRAIEGSLASYVQDPYIREAIIRAPIEEEVEVLIIGGGYGGQLVAVRQLEAGNSNIRIIEKGGDFGGTWYWNRYPGAQCDIESYIYMPLCEETGYVPSEKYSHQPELLDHARRIGRHYGLYEKSLFQTEVHSLSWTNTDARWTARTDKGDTIRARFVICAAGPLHRPKLPGLRGIESFEGHSFHSSRWDYDYTGGDTTGNLSRLSDKSVAIIGTGATAVQIVANLGRHAKQVYVFQRTPSSINIRGNRKTDATWKASLRPGWQQERMDNFNAIVHGANEDRDLVMDSWTYILGTKQLRDNNVPAKEAAKQAQLADYSKMEEIRARVDQIVHDHSTAESLKPYYNQWCKRPCFHDEYLPTFNRSNVELIDTDGKGVQAIETDGVRANDRLYPVDCIIYATGFELATDWSHRSGIDILGQAGNTLTSKWSKGVSSLHGYITRDFPNCFFITTVQAGLTPNFIHMTAEQAAHFAYVVKTCREREIESLQPSEEAEEAWVDTVLQKGKLKMKFNAECTPGYYNNEGRVNAKTARQTSYGGGALEFLELMAEWRRQGKLEGMEVMKFKN